MDEAIAIARKATTTGDVPVGAIVINKDGVIIGSGSNEREAKNDPTAHAEVVADAEAGDDLAREGVALALHQQLHLRPLGRPAEPVLQEAQRERVERLHDAAVRKTADAALEPLAEHVSGGRVVHERERALGRRALTNEGREALDQDGALAGTGSGRDEDGPFAPVGGGLLVGIENDGGTGGSER